MLFPVLFALLALLPGIAGARVQSALHPGGEQARLIAELAWVMIAGGALIFVAVIALAAAALFGGPRWRAVLAGRALILGGGIVFPAVVLSALLVYSLLATVRMAGAGESPAARIEIAAELWWWRVSYLDEAGNTIMETANEIHLPAGRPVEIRLVSRNVIHSFWIPGLAGKTDVIPGHANTMRVRAEAPGIFRGQCAEYCGAQHANMALHAVAQSPEEFEAWLAAQTLPARQPRDPVLQRGRHLFLVQDCARCHTVRGTPAAGRDGPDLTHAGSRHSLAAGLLPNTVGGFGGWIAASRHLKPGNKMPSFDQLPAEDLRALAAYMESLE